VLATVLVSQETVANESYALHAQRLAELVAAARNLQENWEKNLTGRWPGLMKHWRWLRRSTTIPDMARFIGASTRCALGTYGSGLRTDAITRQVADSTVRGRRILRTQTPGDSDEVERFALLRRRPAARRVRMISRQE